MIKADHSRNFPFATIQFPDHHKLKITGFFLPVFNMPELVSANFDGAVGFDGLNFEGAGHQRSR